VGLAVSTDSKVLCLAILAGVERNKMPYLGYLNSLDWDPMDNTVLANAWFKNTIVRTLILKWVKFCVSTTFSNSAPRKADVMNGIALHSVEEHTWWITGQVWPNLHLVELLE
jgi:glutamine cyclotransferase